MTTQKFVHDNAKIKVHDNLHDKDRIFTLTVKDHWGFIGDSKDNTLTEMNLPNDKFSLVDLKHMFQGGKYPANYDSKEHESYVDESGREHIWSKQNDKMYVDYVIDTNLSKRYKLLDVQEKGKSIMPQAFSHFLQDPEVNKPAYLVSDVTDEVSGPITPTTTKALRSLKKAVYDDIVDLQVSPDSELTYAGNLPTGSLTNGSKLVLNKGANADDIKLDNSSITCDKGQIINSIFKDTTSYNTSAKADKDASYIYNSNFNNVHLLDNNKVSSSIIDYASLNNARIKDSSLKGGNYADSTIDHGYTWLTVHSVVSGSTLKNTRVENRHIQPNDYKAKSDQLVTSTDEMYDKKHVDTHDTIISDSHLDNTQILSNEDIGSTINNSSLKNTFVKEWVVADKSKLVATRPSRPFLVGRVSFDNNDLQFTNDVVCMNLDEYSSNDARDGYELPKGASYDDTNIGKMKHAVELKPNHHDIKKLAKLDHGHYVLNDGDKAFENLIDVLQDDGGKHIALAKNAPEVAKSTPSDDGPEL